MGDQVRGGCRLMGGMCEVTWVVLREGEGLVRLDVLYYNSSTAAPSLVPRLFTKEGEGKRAC